MRYFIALELPKNVIQLLDVVVQDIREQKLIEGKFVEKYNLHLTLKFLGELDTRTLNLIMQTLETIKLPAFKVSLGCLGLFTKEQPRVLWVALESAEIFSLTDMIEQALVGVVSREQKPFAAHVTLARIKRVVHKNFYQFIENYHVEPVEFVIDSFRLKQSQLTNNGPIYTDVACYPLKNLEK